MRTDEFIFILCASGSAVEHLLAKEGVAGSIPVSRSCKTFSKKVFFISKGAFTGASFLHLLNL